MYAEARTRALVQESAELLEWQPACEESRVWRLPGPGDLNFLVISRLDGQLSPLGPPLVCGGRAEYLTGSNFEEVGRCLPFFFSSLSPPRSLPSPSPSPHARLSIQ